MVLGGIWVSFFYCQKYDKTNGLGLRNNLWLISICRIGHLVATLSAQCCARLMLEQLLQQLWCVENTIQEHIGNDFLGVFFTVEHFFTPCGHLSGSISNLANEGARIMCKGVQNNSNHKRYVWHFQNTTKPTVSALEKELFHFVSFLYHPPSRPVMWPNKECKNPMNRFHFNWALNKVDIWPIR